MRPLIKTICLLIACASMCVPPSLEAQTRGRNGGGGGQPQRTHQQHKTKDNKNHNNGGSNKNHGTSRPGGGGVGNNKGHNKGHDNGRRPGGNNVKPGNNHQRPPQGHNPGFGNQRPPQGPSHNQRPPKPPKPPKPGHGYKPGPVHGYHHIHFGSPHRPMMPPPAPYRRPLPPPRYVPVRQSLFSTILGITIGTALNISLSNLVDNGYSVSAYGNDAIYVSNVRQLGLAWPDATLYYNNGYLDASQFVYSTSYYNTNRYDTAYNMLVNNYGPPVQTQSLAGGGMLSSWWGPSGQYVTLQFSAQNALGGALRYYTTLSIGN